MMGQVFKDRRLLFGALPVNLLDRSSLSPMARLLFVVLDSCGVQQLDPSLSFLAVRMGMHPNNKRTVLKYLRELVDAGFLKVKAGAGGEGANSYELTMPEYCWVNSPRLLQLAVKEPVEPSSPTWTAGKGKTSPPPRKKAAVDRLAWNSARQARLDRQRAAGQQLALAPAPAPAAPVSVEHQAPAGGGCSLNTGGGVQRTPDPVFIEHPKKETQLEPRNKREHAGTPAPPPAALSKDGTPVGWEGWAAAWAAAHGRPWTWTATARRLALQVNAAVGHQGLVAPTWTNYLRSDYWRAKAHPLQGLVAQVHEHLPKLTPDQQLLLPAGTFTLPPPPAPPACRHKYGDVQHVAGEQHGVAGTFTVTSCRSCGVELSRVFHRDPTPAELEAMARFKADCAKKGIHVSA